MVRKGPPLPGYGVAEWIGGEQVLVVGTHDPARDGWDHIGWESIIAHEWTHLHHGTRVFDRTYFRYRQRPLAHRFLADEQFRVAVGTLANAAHAQHLSCDTPVTLVTAWEDVNARLSSKHQRASAAWLFTEGIARYFESGWENAARKGGPEELEALRTPQCTNAVDGGDYAYPLGCGIALALDTCLGPGWLDTAWATGFEAGLDRLR